MAPARRPPGPRPDRPAPDPRQTDRRRTESEGRGVRSVRGTGGPALRRPPQTRAGCRPSAGEDDVGGRLQGRLAGAHGSLPVADRPLPGHHRLRDGGARRSPRPGGRGLRHRSAGPRAAHGLPRHVHRVHGRHGRRRGGDARGHRLRRRRRGVQLFRGLGSPQPDRGGQGRAEPLHRRGGRRSGHCGHTVGAAAQHACRGERQHRREMRLPARAGHRRRLQL